MARRLLWSPWPWAVVLLGGSTALVVSDPAVGFVAFLLALGGGWLCGIGVVSAASRGRRPGTALVTLAVAAVAAGLLLWGFVAMGPAIARAVPPLPRAALTVLQFAAPPGAGWIWLAALARVVDLIPGGRRTAPAATSPSAELVPPWVTAHDVSELRFTAVPLRMRTLRLLIAALMVVVGGCGGALIVATGDLAARLGPTAVVVVVGVVIALPAVLLFRGILNRRSVDCLVRVDLARARLQVTAGAATLEVALRDIDRLCWRRESDYARLEVRAGRLELTLLCGLARGSAGTAARLPALPRRVEEALQRAGLTASVTRGGSTIWNSR